MVTIDQKGQRLAPSEHDPEKPCPALDAGWIPVFGKIMLHPETRSVMTSESEVVTLLARAAVAGGGACPPWRYFV
jgi:hypothetical protein